MWPDWYKKETTLLQCAICNVKPYWRLPKRCLASHTLWQPAHRDRSVGRFTSTESTAHFATPLLLVPSSTIEIVSLLRGDWKNKKKTNESDKCNSTNLTNMFLHTPKACQHKSHQPICTQCTPASAMHMSTQHLQNELITLTCRGLQT